MTRSFNNALPKPPKRDYHPHVVEVVSFSQDSVLCKCAWQGTILDYDVHRKVNARTKHRKLEEEIPA